MLLDTYKTWFQNHNQPVARWRNATQPVGVEGQTFYFWKSLVESGGDHPYKLILGYAMVNNLLQGRMWYYSGSEATWRVFTGWRVSGAWTKGAEHETAQPKETYTSMGYIFECFTTVDMGQALDTFWSKHSASACINLYPWPEQKIVYKDKKGIEHKSKYLIPPKAGSGDFELFKYLVGDYSEIEMQKLASKQTDALKPPGICIPFNQDGERKFVLAGLPNMTGAISTGITNNAGSVQVQNSYRRNSIVDYSQELLKETDLNQWLKSAVQSGPIKSTHHYHPVLNQKYTVYSYKLKPVAGAKPPRELVVEIAAGNSFHGHIYTDWNGAARSLSTPICWVRDAYYFGGTINSFGSRREIPINLSFLVQKPCDYRGQISKNYMADIDIPSSEIAGKYIVLSMLNEETSCLLREFKIKNAFPLFEHLSTAKVDVERIKDIVKQCILNGIAEYQSLRLGVNNSGYTVKGSHGSAGDDRARELKTAINGSVTLAELNTALYGCFVTNRIGAFSGGWLSGINTNPTSLFTCVCRKLLGQFVRLGDEVEASRLKKNDKSRYGGYVGPQGSLNRLIHYVQTTPVPENTAAELFITNEAANLLKAIKG